MTETRWEEEALRKWRQERSRDALGELLKSRRDRAYSLAVRLGLQPGDAEDAVQEAFVKLMSRETGFGSAAEFDVTVYRAVFQCAMDALRRGGRRARWEAAAARAAADAAAAGQQTEDEMPVNGDNDLRGQLRAAVHELPEETRGPAVLCYYQGLSEAEAARVLDMPRTTLRRRLAEAVEDLRRRLGLGGKRLGAAAIAGLLVGDGTVSAPASLCAALDRLLPGRCCAEVPALAVPAGPPALAAAAGAVKAACAVLAAATCAALVMLGAGAFNPGARPQSDSSRNEDSSPRTTADVRPSGGTEEVPVPMGREEETEMRGKMGGLAAVAGGLFLSGVAGAGEPNAEVAAVIAKIQARQAAKAEAAAKDAAERTEMYKKQGEGHRYGQ